MSVTSRPHAHRVRDRASSSYLFERSEEGRAVRVGEKETSEQAEIVARYADLFTPRAARRAPRGRGGAATGDERERLYRLRKTCEGGLVSAELAEREDELENALLAARVTFQGEEMPLRNAQAQLAVLAAYADREELGELQAEASAAFNAERLELLARGRGARRRALRASPTPVERNEEEKGISLREPRRALAAASDDVDGRATTRLRERWFERLLGAERAEVPVELPHGVHAPAVAARGDVHEGARDRGLPRDARRARLRPRAEPNIKLDLDDRPQKSPRACVIACDPPKVVHLITRAQGGLHDYQAFLHEAGHALHYAGCDPSLPYTFRRISRDHALTEIYSYIVEAITREPGLARAALRPLRRGGRRERRGDDVPRGAALPPLRGEAAVRARLLVAVRRRRRRRRTATPSGSRPRRPASAIARDAYLSDMDAGFYSADYLRAWIRSAQLRAHLTREVGEDWWRNAGDRRPAARRSSARARSRRARRSPAGSASTRSTRRRCCTRWRVAGAP